MRSLEHLCPESRASIRGVLFDIDDTLTTDGVLTADAYAALARLKAAGLMVVPITGRPAGWCDQIARIWPVDAVVGENGAFYFRYDRLQRRMQRRFVIDAVTRAAQRVRLSEIAQHILDQVAGSALASDQPYREADIAIDFCEDVARLNDADVARIKALMVAAGLHAKVSSIHVNGWFGDYDKLSTTRLLFREVFAIDLDAEQAHFVFIGDSPNDAPMFAFFDHSIGVANVADAIGIETLPAYVTRGRCGDGFCEAVAVLLGCNSK